MKNITVVMTLACLLAGCQKNQPALELATISTPTMVCEMCVKTIEKAVYRVEGVKDVNVDLVKKSVEVKYVPLQTNVQYMESAITAVGYDANDKKRDPDAYENLAGCCKVD